MGRIKTTLIKRTTRDIFKYYGKEARAGDNSFEYEKKVISAHVDPVSKKVRNIIAGYASRLAKRKEA